MSSYRTITFISDLGTVDESVGAVKSVIRDLAPETTVVDLTHNVPAFDVRAASIALLRAAKELVPGVVLAVVNPETSNSKRCIAVEVGDGESVLVGPDNGVLAPIVALSGGATRAVVLNGTGRSISRNVLGPAAAALSAGVDLEALGVSIDPSELQPAVISFAEVEGTTVKADVFWIDHFGNVQTNVSAETVASWGDKVVVEANGQRTICRKVQAFSELLDGEVGIVTDANDLVLLAVREGSAALLMGLSANDSLGLRAALA